MNKLIQLYWRLRYRLFGTVFLHLSGPKGEYQQVRCKYNRKTGVVTIPAITIPWQSGEPFYEMYDLPMKRQ